MGFEAPMERVTGLPRSLRERSRASAEAFAPIRYKQPTGLFA